MVKYKLHWLWEGHTWIEPDYFNLAESPNELGEHTNARQILLAEINKIITSYYDKNIKIFENDGSFEYVPTNLDCLDTWFFKRDQLTIKIQAYD